MNPEDTFSPELFRYLISGFAVQSDTVLPSAIPHPFAGEPDIRIRRSKLPPSTERSDGDDIFRFRVPAIGRFLMRDGEEILYEVFPEHDPGLLPLHLIGICFATLLQQRGNLVLHASAVSVGGRAVLFCGESGAGKSTLAAMLCDRGYPLLNDDVCNLKRGGDGTYSVSPDGRMLKLWSASLEQLKHPDQGARVIGNIDKFYALPANSDAAERPVGAIYFLHQPDGDAPPGITPLGVARAMAALHENAYRPELVRAMGQQGSYFQAAASLCKTVPVLQLSRPKDFAQAGAVLDLLEASWRGRIEQPHASIPNSTQSSS